MKQGRESVTLVVVVCVFTFSSIALVNILQTLVVARLPASVRTPDRNASVAPGTEVCVCGCACVCVKVCVCLSMARSETTRTASSVLSPVNMGAQNFTTPVLLGAFKKK